VKFNIEKIVLWLQNGSRREIRFLPNKVNVITGDSNTGKTAILEIIDYCFFASSSKISESMINENISWYGLVFNINDKKYTIGRKGLTNTKVSDEYYFSSIGEIPESLISNNTGNAIKTLLESEFSIDNNVSIPYGSNIIKPGSKISLRYFFLFNTISGNIIENDSGVFFDKQDEPRYRDALPRIFDLAVGIETVENILKKEKKIELQKKITKLSRKNKILSEKYESFREEKESLIKKAKGFSLISNELDFNSSFEELKKEIDNVEQLDGNNEHRSEIERDYYLLERKIKNLKIFSSEYGMFKKNLVNIEDSLKPIEFLKRKDSELIKTSIFEELMNSYSSELNKIKISRKNKTPIDKQVTDTITDYQAQLTNLKDQLAILPQRAESFDNDKSKYMFLGEIKAKINIFSNQEDSIISKADDGIEALEKQLKLIEIDDTTEKKELTIKLVEEVISDYIDSTNKALENYANYKPVFEYQNKSLRLRKPKTSFIENVGSSSNHMFLHLFFSLAMQEIAFQNNSPYVAPYLVIDQPSRPYYGEDSTSERTNIDHSDESKITEAFDLLNSFIKTRNENGAEFQMIIFEHVPARIFDGLDNIHLVEEFRNGNALVPDVLLF
jgi:hypothetical protein